MSARIGWQGVGIRLDGDAGLVDQVLAGMPDFYSEDVEVVVRGTVGSADGRFVLELPEGLGVSGPLGPESLRAAASRVELCVVDRLPGILAVHSGVVAVDGSVIIVPGASMAGKSTLVRALLDAGGTYLSDEYALVDPDGGVRPYPRRMTVRTPSGSRRIEAAVSRPVGSAPLPVGLIAVVAYDTAGWSVRAVSAAAAVMQMAANAVNLGRHPVLGLNALAAASEGAARIVGTRGEADDAARRLIELVRSERAETQLDQIQERRTTDSGH